MLEQTSDSLTDSERVQLEILASGTNPHGFVCPTHEEGDSEDIDYDYL